MGGGTATGGNTPKAGSNPLMDMLKSLEGKASEETSCTFMHLVDSLEVEVRDQLMKLIETPAVSTRQIFLALHQSGYKIARESVSLHRKHECTCEVMA